MTAPKFKIVYGYTHDGRPKIKKFASLEDAKKIAQRVFERTGIVIGIDVIRPAS